MRWPSPGFSQGQDHTETIDDRETDEVSVSGQAWSQSKAARALFGGFGQKLRDDLMWRHLCVHTPLCVRGFAESAAQLSLQRGQRP